MAFQKAFKILTDYGYVYYFFYREYDKPGILYIFHDSLDFVVTEVVPQEVFDFNEFMLGINKKVVKVLQAVNGNEKKKVLTTRR